MQGLAGSFVPLATPFTDDGSGISEVRLARLIKRVLDLGAAGLVACSDAGEFSALSFMERKAFVELALRLSQGAVPILVNVSSLNTSASLDLAQHAVRHGARSVIMQPPYYGNFEPREIEAHFRAVTRYSESSVIVVDKGNTLRSSAQDSLTAMGRLVFAEASGGVLRTDTFVLGELAVNSAFHFSLTPGQPLLDAFANTHPAKVIKGLFAELDFDLGPPRQPLLSMPYDTVKEIANTLA